MIATKDFRYYDFERKQSIDVHAGQKLDAETLGRNKVDVEKLHRTKHLDLGVSEGSVDRRPQTIRAPRKSRRSQ